MRELGAVIRVPEKYYPWVGRCNYDGDYVEIDKPVPIYRWVRMERGRELEREIFLNEQDLLYHIFKVTTGLMAFDYTSARKLAFAHQLDLLGKINEGFRGKREREIEEILVKYSIVMNGADVPLN